VALRAFADGALFAEAFGDGQPRVLALHGWGRRSSDYRQALTGLGALAVDLPGFGASPPPDSVIGAEGYASILSPILEEFTHPPVLVGHSFGGRVAVCMAATEPGRVGGLVLTGVPLVRLTATKSPSAAFRAIRALNRSGWVSDDRMEQIRRRRGSADYRAVTGIMRDILVKVIGESYQPQLRKLTSPVELLWGAADTEVPVAVAESARDEIVSAGGTVTLKVLEGIGHLVPTQAPESLRAVVERSLAG
jgi:pimeloyl-ACP methyl ester carboxylesterase